MSWSHKETVITTDIKEMMVQGVNVYFRTDDLGFVFIETDGYRANAPELARIRKALKSLQTEDDREMEQVLRDSERSRANRNRTR